MAEDLYHRLKAHLDDLNSSPTTALDERILDEAALVLPDRSTAEQLTELITQISTILQSYQRDPTPLTLLLERLLYRFSFADVLAFDPPVNFVNGLDPAEFMVPINKLMLFLLQRATNATDTAIVAGWPEVVRALIRLWLSTPDAGVASQAGALLLSFLTTETSNLLDQGQRPLSTDLGEKLMWKRVFTDRDVYGTLFEHCDLKCASPSLSKRQISLAQARLLEILPTMARLDWHTVSRSHYEDIETAHGMGVTEGGLLGFASSYMIDTKDDVLTHVCLLDFFSELLVATKHMQTTNHSSVGLDFLVQNGKHESVPNLYYFADESNDPIERMLLYGPASRYLGTYASNYQEHYMKGQMPSHIEQQLKQKLTQSSTRWSHSEPPKYDLHLLASLPRISLLPDRSGSGKWSNSPLLGLPSTSAPPEVLETLAIIFHGPAKEAVTFPQSSPLTDAGHDNKVEDASAARTLYFQYLSHNQRLWKDIVAHAETVAILDRALAALNLLTAVITANWSTEQEHDLPSDIIATPENGVMAVLSPPALEYVIPYLNKPAQTFSNLVGGRGDAESSAYKIAVAKYEALRALINRLSAQLAVRPDEDLQRVLTTLNIRFAEGPMSRSGEVGGRIATLEL